MPLGARSLANDAAWPWHFGVSVVQDVQRILGVTPLTFENQTGKTNFGEKNVTKITAREAESKNLLGPKITVVNNGVVTVTTLLPGIFPSTIPDAQIDS